MATRTAASKSKTTEVRCERYRIRFDRRAQAALCAQIAGACRLVWNLLLADCERRYRLARAYGKWTDFPPENRPDLSTSFFTLGQRFTDLRSRPDAAWVRSFLRSPWGRRYADLDLSWLRDLPYAPVRYTAKYLAEPTRVSTPPGMWRPPRQDLGCAQVGRQAQGVPEVQGLSSTATTASPFPAMCAWTATAGCTSRKVGWVRLEGGPGLYRGHKPKQVRHNPGKEGDRGKAHRSGTPTCSMKCRWTAEATRLDRCRWASRNVGQATDSDGERVRSAGRPGAGGEDQAQGTEKGQVAGAFQGQRPARSNRGRRIGGQLKKLKRKQKRTRENAAHQHSRKLADTSTHTWSLRT